jgi:hypothetical protein
MRHTLTFCFLFASAAFLGGCSAGGDSVNVTTRSYHIVSPSEAAPHGHAWDEWQALWCNWVFSTPKEHNALWDTAPADSNQLGHGHDNVFFGGGVWRPDGRPPGRLDTTRSITLTKGTAFYLPLANYQDDLATDTARHNSDSEMLAGRPANAQEYYKDLDVLSATVDGEDVPNLINYYSAQAKPYDLVLPPGNFDGGYGVAPGSFVGTTHVLLWGIYLMVDDLTVGTHTLIFNTQFKGSDLFHVTYKITVK